MKNSSNVFLNVSQSNIQTDQVDYLSDGEWWFFGQLLSSLTWWRSWLRCPGGGSQLYNDNDDDDNADDVSGNDDDANLRNVIVQILS